MSEETPESASWGSILAGLAIGAAIGAAVSLLYAPTSGQELREEIGDRLADLKERLDGLTKRLGQVTRARLAETRSDLAQAVEASRSAAAARAAELRRQLGLE